MPDTERSTCNQLVELALINCISIIRDEADVIGECLADAARWSDNIFIADNGSVDGTVEQIREAAARYDNIHFVGIIDNPFHDGLRGELYDRVKERTSPGDWWCRLDANKFFIDHPREFLGDVEPWANCIVGSAFDFKFTSQDYERFLADPSAFLMVPLRERFRWYKNEWAEIRFVKVTARTRWPKDKGWPTGLDLASAKIIRYASYQYRYPQQILTRVRHRQQPSAVSSFQHEQQGVGLSDQELILSRISSIDGLKKLEVEYPPAATPPWFPPTKPPLVPVPVLRAWRGLKRRVVRNRVS